ncbi:MAG: methenyltetrahydromethanopterin cyclohydrolase [Candidatus Hodarchaeales archaeon]|jgi:methenyltetrahydromethanopterin cyclohydrolase
MDLHLNEKAWQLFETLLQDPDKYNVGLRLLRGIRIVDCITMDGSDEAGILISKITLGGYGDIELLDKQIINSRLEVEPLKVTLDKAPHVTTLGSQFAGWRINKKYMKKYPDGEEKKKTFFAMASGPARALKDVLEPKEIYQNIDYKEDDIKTVVLLETDKIPVDEVLTYMYQKCNVLPENLGVICAPTNCRVGSIQIAARVVETAISKFHEVGLDTKTIIHGTGTSFVAPVVDDPLVAMGCTNDGIVFGGDVQLTIKGLTDEILEENVKKIPSSTSPDYGKPFYEIFKEADFDFYKIDPGFFAPAKITLINAESGNKFVAGEVNFEILEKSFRQEKN